MGGVPDAVRDIIGDAGDPTVLEYLVSCLELEDETAKDAAQMYANYGDMLARNSTPPRITTTSTMHDGMQHAPVKQTSDLVSWLACACKHDRGS